MRSGSVERDGSMVEEMTEQGIRGEVWKLRSGKGEFTKRLCPQH